MHNANHYRKDTGDAMDWSALVAGAFVGAGIALLLAPQPGSKLRGMLRHCASRAKGDLLERAEEAFDKGDEVVREAGRSQRKPNRNSRRAGQSIKEFA